MTGIILSGGKNRRMGTNKAFMEIEGERLIVRTVRLFKELFEDVMIVTNAPLEYLDLGVQLVTDIYKGKGSLGGIYTGLFFATSEHAFVAPCDMPFLNQDFIAAMIRKTANHDIVVPELPAGLQPLHAIYSRRCLPVIKKCITTDQLKITSFYKGFHILSLDEKIIRPFDPEGRMFLNINAPEDLEHLT